VIDYYLEPAADRQLDDIYLYTYAHWGADQADLYISGLFTRFNAIAKREAIWRRIAAEYEVDGYYCRYERHFIYWMQRSDGEIGIVAILHESMELKDRLREILGP
jgi:toxin ParE1/3/4